jgi:hypothetical protein
VAPQGVLPELTTTAPEGAQKQRRPQHASEGNTISCCPARPENTLGYGKNPRKFATAYQEFHGNQET